MFTWPEMDHPQERASPPVFGARTSIAVEDPLWLACVGLSAPPLSDLGEGTLPSQQMGVLGGLESGSNLLLGGTIPARDILVYVSGIPLT